MSSLVYEINAIVSSQSFRVKIYDKCVIKLWVPALCRIISSLLPRLSSLIFEINAIVSSQSFRAKKYDKGVIKLWVPPFLQLSMR